MKKLGFLSFGHWSDSYGSQVRSAADSLLQSIELAVAAEDLGADGAYFRVHHFCAPTRFAVPTAIQPQAGKSGAGAGNAVCRDRPLEVAVRAA